MVTFVLFFSREYVFIVRGDFDAFVVAVKHSEHQYTSSCHQLHPKGIVSCVKIVDLMKKCGARKTAISSLPDFPYVWVIDSIVLIGSSLREPRDMSCNDS